MKVEDVASHSKAEAMWRRNWVDTATPWFSIFFFNSTERINSIRQIEKEVECEIGSERTVTSNLKQQDFQSLIVSRLVPERQVHSLNYDLSLTRRFG